MDDIIPFSPRQKEFILNSKAKINLAHGSVRAGKTVCTLFRFMEAAATCKGSQIWIMGYSQGTIYRNIISQLFDSNNKQVGFFRNFCTWQASPPKLFFMNKEIVCIGAGDHGALGVIQGGSIDLCLCDEMTLYPQAVLEMIITRISPPGAQLFGTMNPKEPSHFCKEQLIDKAKDNPDIYYELHFHIDHNIYLEPSYIQMLKDTLSGLFFRRNYMGEWCLAEGAIFDFFERKIHVVSRPPSAAQFYIAAIDYGVSNPFAAVILGYHQYLDPSMGAIMWVEKEYYWDPVKTQRKKVNSEFARDLQVFFGEYPIRTVYIDPSAASFKAELRRIGVSVVDADNDVYNGIQVVSNLMKEGTLKIMDTCQNLIREIQSYSWDPRKSALGEDEPIKKDDHAIDATRYAVKSLLKNRSTLRLRMDTPESGKTLGSSTIKRPLNEYGFNR